MLTPTKLILPRRFDPAIKQIRTLFTHRFNKVARRGGKRKKYFTKHYQDKYSAFYERALNAPKLLSDEQIENMKRSFNTPIKTPSII